MMRLTRTAIGLLTAQYRSVLRKCFLINVGLYALLAPAASLTTATAVAVTAMPKTAVGETVEVGPTETVDDLDGIYTGADGVIAIQNRGTINNITGTIINSYRQYWGAGIWTWDMGGPGLIKNIAARIINNRSEAIESWDLLTSGAGIEIASQGQIEKIKNSIFIGNNVYNTYGGGTNRGGAIVNERGTIGEISDTLFLGNYVLNTDGGTSLGGAIYNIDGNMNSISGTFINNYVQANSGDAQGGAIGNNKDIGSIGAANDKALFIGNYAQSESGKADGGAIYNAGTISGDINADFIGNHVEQHQATFSSQNSNWGGAIYNAGDMGNISGNFINNGITTTGGDYQSLGGAIANHHKDNGELSSIKTISGIFIGNYVNTNHGAGGAITNYQGKIAAIDADFIGNTVHNQNVGYSEGGAISSGGTGSAIGSIKGSFINNLAETSSTSEVSTSNEGVGGAINNGYNSAITSIEADFIGNKASSTSSVAKGGAISNDYTISNITADFINNSATSTSGFTRGGAIYNSGTITNVTGEFKGNETSGSGYWQEGDGAAIHNTGNMTVTNSYFNENKGGIINSRGAYGGAIYNGGTLTLTDSSFNNSYAYGDGADIRTDGILNINAVNKDVMFSNPYSYYGQEVGENRKRVSISNIKYNGDGILNLNAAKGHSIIINGTLRGGSLDSEGTYNINSGSDNIGGEYVINGDILDSSFINLYNDANVRFGNVRHNDGTVLYGNLGAREVPEEQFSFATTVGEAGKTENNGATMNFANANADQTQSFGALTLDGNLKLGLDSGEKIAASSATGEGSILIDYINYASTPADNQISWAYADSGNAVINKVANSTATVNTPYQTFTGAAVKNGNVMNVTLSNGTENLAGFLSKNTTGTTYDMARDEQMLVDLGAMAGENNAKTVNANGHNIIGNQHAGVTLADGQTLTINDANVEGFYKESDVTVEGGSIINAGVGTVNINNSVFRNNMATGFGGGIYSEGNTTISNSSFVNNLSRGDVGGGAVYNAGTMTVNGSTFEGNTFSEIQSGSDGAALYNKKDINITNSTFSNNSAGWGAAFYNHLSEANAEIANSTFKYNSVTSNGGAVYNERAKITAIENSTFIGNDARNQGGAIKNDAEGTISIISGSEFDRNTAMSQGGAIYNAGTIGEFDADEKPVEGKGIINTTFKGNYINSEGSNVSGGAIYNASGAKISNIENSVFDGNMITTKTGEIWGGVIYNAGEIDSIDASFTNNITRTESGYVTYGGVINNTGTIDTIKGLFKDNLSTTDTKHVEGGVISSTGNINNIYADFINNKVIANNTAPQVASTIGALFLEGHFGNIGDDSHKATFQGNQITELDNSSWGAAIGLYLGEIDNLNADFIGNQIVVRDAGGSGAALASFVGAKIGNINGTFSNNSVISTGTGDAKGGAIHNGEGTSITSIGTADNHAKFEGNYAQANTGNAYGGAIYNAGTIDNIYADFTNNKAESASGRTEGGAIYNAGTIKNLTGRFEDNKADGYGTIYNSKNLTINDSSFVGNITKDAGAILNDGSNAVLNIYNTVFKNNTAVQTGAVYNRGGLIENIEADFINNTSTDNVGGAIQNWTDGGSHAGVINRIKGTFKGNGTPNGSSGGGAIFNSDTINSIEGTFVDNYSNTAGAAIVNQYVMGIEAKDIDTIFRNNKTTTGSTTTYSDILNTNTIHLNAAQNKSIDFGGSLKGSNGTLNINDGYNSSSTGGDYIFRNEVSGQTMNLYNGANVQLRQLRQADGTVSVPNLNLTGFTSTGAGNILDVRDLFLGWKGRTNYQPVLGAVTLNNNTNLRLAVDGAFSPASAGDYLEASSFSGSGKFQIDYIDVHDKSSSLTSALIANDTLKSHIEMASTYHVFDKDYKDNFTVTYNAGTGYLNFTPKTGTLNLVGYLSNASSTATTPYDMTSDEPVLRTIGDMTGTTKTVNAGDYTINGNGFTGVTVGENQTLNINGGVWDGFFNSTNAGVINNSGTLSVNNAKFTNNTLSGGGDAAAIYNAGIITTLTGDFTGNRTGTGYGFGGAILNHQIGIINSISANFENNTSIGSGNGGAITNRGTISDLYDSTFTNNTSKVSGGAIENPGTLTINAKNKDVTFSNNTADTSGGAIYNYGAGTSVTTYTLTINATGGDVIFKNNTAGSLGSAIYNAGTLNINATGGDVVFEGNTSGGGGTAIYSNGNLSITSIGDHKVIFRNNSSSNVTHTQGALMISSETAATAGTIKADFINNTLSGGVGLNAAALGNYAILGGTSTITEVIGDFVGNGITTSANNAQFGGFGGALGNITYHANSTSSIGTINANFSNNYMTGTYGNGGAIANHANLTTDGTATSTITSIIGDFDNNYVSATNLVRGGAIYNYSELGNTATTDSIGSSTEKSTFTGNYAETSGTNAYGGGIYNNAQIGSINADFTGNYAKSTGEYAAGGQFITRDGGGSGAALGGAIFNIAQLDSEDHVIENTGFISSITGSFINNYVYSENGWAVAGAIYNDEGTIGQIGSADSKVLFKGNYAKGNTTSAEIVAGAISLTAGSIIGDIYADFQGNYAENTIGSGYAGAFYSMGAYLGADKITYNSIIGDFVDNYAKGGDRARGGAFYANADVVKRMEGDFTGNHVIAGTMLAQGGAMFLMGTEINTLGSTTENHLFSGNYATSKDSYAQGGAIWNGGGTIGTLDTETSKLLADNTGIINTSFEGNYVRGNDESTGGAIFNSGNINLSALQSDVNFWNNKANDRYNDIYNSGTMNFNAAQNKTMSFGGSIEGAGAININTGTTNGGTYVFKSDVSAGNVVVGSADSGYAPATLSFEKATQEDGSTTNGTFDVDSLTINGDGNSLSTRNDKVDTNSATTLTLNNALNLQIDGDLQSHTGDSIAVSNLTAAAPKSLRLTAMNFTTDPDVTTLSKTDTIDVNITGENDILAQNNAYTLASTNPDDTTEEQIEQAYLNNLTSSSRNYNKTYAFRSAKLLTSANNQTYVEYGDAITLKWLYEDYINGWSGEYIKNNVTDGGSAVPGSTLTVGGALMALDSALGKNDTYNFATQSVADVLVNNYYMNVEFSMAKSFIKAANDNHKNVIVRSAKHDVTIFGRQSDNTATTTKQAA